MESNYEGQKTNQFKPQLEASHIETFKIQHGEVEFKNNDPKLIKKCIYVQKRIKEILNQDSILKVQNIQRLLGANNCKESFSENKKLALETSWKRVMEHDRQKKNYIVSSLGSQL